MSIDHAVPHDHDTVATDFLEEFETAASPTTESGILLDARWIRFVLDVLGVVTMFATIALTMTVRDAVVVTSAVGVLVVVARVTRWFGTLRRVVRETTPPVV